MPYGLYISAEGAQAQTQRMEIIANNLANVDTAGFKRQMAVIQARHSEAIEQGEDTAGSNSINDIGGGTLVRQTLTDHSRGTLKQTGIPTDAAIDGEGFFEVSRNGQRYFTRAGNFMIGSNGQLQTPNGYDVLGASGGPMTIPADALWHIQSDGSIVDSQTGGAFGILSVMRAQQPGDLVHHGENLFSSLSDMIPVRPGEANVRGGYLEMSGVTATTEMVEMIETSRAFEANLKVIQNQDSMIDSLLNRVLRSS